MISQRHMNDVFQRMADSSSTDSEDHDKNARNPFDATFNHIKNTNDKGTLSSLVV